MKKFLPKCLLSFLLLLLSSKIVLAQVVINEFSSNSDPEWVEIYNNTDQIIDLLGWRILDGNSIETDDLQLSGCLAPRGFRLFNRQAGWLNNTGGDTIILKNSDNEEIDKVIYGEGGVISIPPNGKSAGRDPDGGSNWKIFDSPSPVNNDCQISLSPVATHAPTLSLSPTPSKSLSPRGIYKINDVKDENGTVLKNVKVYVDDVYIHHYAPEILTFCDGCKCDTYVDCGFGDHEIRLEKSGYEDWIEEITIKGGETKEVNPIMKLIPTQTPTYINTATPQNTLAPTSLVTSQPTEKISPTLKKTPTPKPTKKTEVLGKEKIATSSAKKVSPTITGVVKGAKSSSFKKDLPKILIVFGILSIAAMVVTSFLLPKINRL